MATLTSAFRASLVSVTSTVDLVGSLATTASNHAKVWELESAAKLEQRAKDVTVLALANSKTYKQDQALKLMQARRSIEDQLKTQSDRELFQQCLDELTQ